MKQIKLISQLVFVALMILVSSCRKTELPQVLTLEVTEVTKTTAVVSGKIVYDGGDALSEFGICFSTGENPGIADTTVVVQNQKANFSCELQNLQPSNKYYARAYAINKEGVAYGKVISFLTEFETITDIEGNIYNIVQIGTQTWMAENLKTATLNTGESIPYVPNSTNWQYINFSMAYCWYDNDFELYGKTYGALYNHYAIQSGKLCPEGWRVPDDDDWLTLIEYLGGEAVAGGKLKETGITHWESPNTGATNEVLFNGLPGGCRLKYGTYVNVNKIGYWWSASNYGNDYISSFWSVFYNRNNITGNLTGAFSGKYVRCVKN